MTDKTTYYAMEMSRIVAKMINTHLPFHLVIRRPSPIANPGPHHGGVRGDFLRYFDSFSRLLPFTISLKLYSGVTLYAITVTGPVLRHRCTRLAYSVAVSAQSYQAVVVRQFYHRVVSGVLRDAQT